MSRAPNIFVAAKMKIGQRRIYVMEIYVMHLHQKIYEFAASAGALEGYVYRRAKTAIDVTALSKWADNLLDAYRHLPVDAVAEFQSSCNQTLGRAIRSLGFEFGEDHPVVGKLKKIVKGELPATPDDFQKQKWFQG